MLHLYVAKSSMEYVVYTDGGCQGNPGPGGWAFVVCWRENTVERSDALEKTTNNRMELTAVIESLIYIRKHIHKDNQCASDKNKISIHTDSQYVKQGITVWIKRWLSNNWRTSNRVAVKNQDLWKKLLAFTDNLQIQWHWVKGHDGNHYNERCDNLVKSAIKKINK